MNHLKFYNNFQLYERSSLTKLGIPKEVMQQIQSLYKLDPDARWERIIKSEVKNILESYDRALIIEMCIDYIKVITTFNDKYMYEVFEHEEGEWGGKFKRKPREFSNLTRTMFDISKDSLFWLLEGDDFETLGEKNLKIKNDENLLDITTLDFKIHLVENFNRITKRMYGEKYKNAILKILSNLQLLLKKGSTLDIELKQLIDNNAELKILASKYKKLKEDEDIMGLRRLEQKYNSLSIFDEFLIEFEAMYSDIFEVHWNIVHLIDMFGLEKITTAFMYFLLTGKLMKLK